MIISTKEWGDIDLITMLEAEPTLYDRLNVIYRYVLKRVDEAEAKRLLMVCAEVAVMCERGSSELSEREACLLEAAATYLKNPTEENRKPSRVKWDDIPDPHRRSDKRRQPWAAWAVGWVYDVADNAHYRGVECAALAAKVVESEGVDVSEANALLMKAVADL